jgi:hypothetical protein
MKQKRQNIRIINFAIIVGVTMGLGSSKPSFRKDLLFWNDDNF